MKVFIVDYNEDKDVRHTITNFEPDRLNLYLKSIEIYKIVTGKNDLFIGNHPKDCNGRFWTKQGYELVTTNFNDKSDFWRIHESLKNGNNFIFYKSEKEIQMEKIQQQMNELQKEFDKLKNMN